jgi:hypothetical protein
MRNAVLCGVCAGLLGLIALPSWSAAQGSSDTPPECPPARQERGSPAQIGGLWRAELPWLAAGMRPEEVARFLSPCGAVEGAGQPAPAARQPVEAAGAAPDAAHSKLH